VTSINGILRTPSSDKHWIFHDIASATFFEQNVALEQRGNYLISCAAIVHKIPFLAGTPNMISARESASVR
jgi:hypothetical protein